MAYRMDRNFGEDILEIVISELSIEGKEQGYGNKEQLMNT
jgi:hypothetical protein